MEGYNTVSEIFSYSALKVIKDSLEKSLGYEIFWGCYIDNSLNLIDKIETIFYGNTNSVIFDKKIAIKYDLVLHNHPSGFIEPSDEDQKIAYQCMKLGVGFAIIDNDISECYIVVPPKSVTKRKKVDTANVENIFKNVDELNKVIQNYKIRDSQLDLSKLILEVINDDKIAFIEAPTGIGKSLAYLIPILLYALENKVKIVISTYTKNLQNQLIKKDIPSALKIIKKDLKFEVAYGRQNYLCLLAYSHLKNDFNNFLFISFDSEILDLLDEWVKKTNNGLLLELSSDIDKALINEIKSNSSTCLKGKCKYYDKCFFYNAKRRLNASDIIVTNHHLLLSYELSDEISDFFPPYNSIIFDEGHNLVDVIEDLSTISFSTLEIQKKLSRFINAKNSGILQSLENLLSNKIQDDKIIKTISFLKLEIQNILNIIIKIQNQDVYELMEFAKNEKIYGKNKILINLTELAKIKIDKLNYIQDLFDEFFNKISVMTSYFNELYEYLNKIMSETKLIKEITDESSFLFFISSIKSIIHFLTEVNHFNEEFKDLSSSNKNQNYIKVLWLEIINNSITFNFYDEEKSLNFNNIVEIKSNSSIFISATLASENSFNYIKEQLNITSITDKRLVEKIYPPIFAFNENSCLYIIKGVDPSNKERYKSVAKQLITKILDSCNAKTMILTTSYDDIKDFSENIKEANNEKDLFIHNENFNSNLLIEEFKKNKNGVLIANMGFWEGIDLPGKHLEILIISKLPFKVPDTPILKAKTDKLDSMGINSFYKLSLPYAIIKLKQGFGRLIRSESEKGICILLDDRVISKNYGKLILNSLPNPKIEVVSVSEFFDNFISMCKNFSIMTKV